MAPACPYAVVRLHDGTYSLEHMDGPASSRCALVKPVTDRTGKVLGWKLKPLVCMLGSKSRLWTSPAEAITATKLMKPGQAKAALAQADAARLP